METDFSHPWPAPAKLNLFLHVLGRRPDGYHDLQTLFQLLGWGDELFIEPTAGRAIERLSDLPGVAPEQDLAVRAARLLQAETGTQAGARLLVDKRIPAGAGLGGASSDAATVLVALNHLWGCGLNALELAALGARLGADVPVFVHGHSGWAEGIGERLTPLALGERHYVLLFPGIAVSTADIFHATELRRDSNPMVCPGPGELWGAEPWRNDCEPVVFARHPEIAEMAADLAPFGTPRMTGTGSTLFIMSMQKSHAERVTMQLKSRYNVRAVKGVDRSPLRDRVATG